MTTTPSSTTASAQLPQPATARLFGLEIVNTTTANVLDWLAARARAQRPTLVNFVNAHCLNIACANAPYREALQCSDQLLPDGSGVRLALALRGVKLVENLNGTDLFPHLCRMAAREQRSMFLLGAAPGVAEQVARNARERFGDLNIVGTHDGFFGDDQEAEIVEAINRSGADILLVAMGVPRQELWLARNRDRLRPALTLGVGGLFDFHAERVSRAPAWLRRAGLEWTWRLAQEPRRLWQRYVLGNPAFIVRACIDAIRHGRRPAVQRPLPQRPGRARLTRLSWWLSTRATPLGRRVLDVLGAGTALLLGAPLFAATALAIRLESRGPVFFGQTRVGLRGQPFKLWKFRSMYIDAEARRAALAASNEMDGGVLFKIKRDPRITRVGRVIRRLSIDELPQLWNVLRGEMSLVGPRPALPSEVAKYTLDDRDRLCVRPGLTCIWQVSGRSDVPFERQVQMDVDYIHRATLATDLELLLRTIPAVLGGRGAY